MGVDSEIIMGGSAGSIFRDREWENYKKVVDWCKNISGFGHFYKWETVFDDGVRFLWHCEAKNIIREEFLKFVESLEWSDDLFVLIASNGDEPVMHLGCYNPERTHERI